LTDLPSTIARFLTSLQASRGISKLRHDTALSEISHCARNARNDVRAVIRGVTKIVGLCCLLLSHVYAEQSTLPSVPTDRHNNTALKRGAVTFMNYCSGCHALRYMRYNRMAQDLGMTDFDGKVDKEWLKIT
jgi:cytochrome c1